MLASDKVLKFYTILGHYMIWSPDDMNELVFRSDDLWIPLNIHMESVGNDNFWHHCFAIFDIAHFACLDF